MSVITENSIPYFPEGINILSGTIHDKALDHCHPINPTAEIFLTKIDGKKNITSILGELQTIYPSVKKDILSRDFYNLIESMLRQSIVSLKAPLKDRVLIMMFNLLWGKGSYQFSRGHRYSVKGTHFPAIFANILYIIFKRLAILLIPLNIMFVFLAIGFNQMTLLIPEVLMDSFIFGIFLSIAIHEAGHLYALRKLTKNPHYGCLIAHFLAYKIARPTCKDDAIIAFSGPMIASLLGIIGIWLSLFIHAPMVHITIQWIALLFVLHSLNLLPVLPDGKHVFQHVFNSNVHRYKETH